jgi:hypothetical protein
MGLKPSDRIDVTQDRDKYRAFMKTIMNFRFP